MFKNKVLLITGGTGSFGNAVLSKFLTSDFKEFILLSSSIKLRKTKEKKSKPNKEGLKFFALSIFYLFSLFSALVIDHLIKIWKIEEKKI